jgi:hypothetical protein
MTTAYGPYSLSVPDRGDYALGPANFRAFADSLAPLLGGAQVLGGTLAARPSAGTAKRLYVVSGDGTASNNGLVYYDNGTAWTLVGQSLRAAVAYAAATGDVPFASRGVSGQTGDLQQWQTSTGTALSSVKANGRFVGPVDPVTTFTRDSTNNNRVTQIVVTQGGSTIKTTSFTYNASDGTVNTITESGTAEGRTVTSTFAYTSGVLTSVTKAVS